MPTVRPIHSRLTGWLSVFMVLLALGIVAPRPSAQAQSVASLHLALGNPSGAVTSPSSPTNYLLQKNQYAVSYHRDNGEANWVSWHLASPDIGSANRSDNFQPDTTLPSGWYRVTDNDYKNSGYDRGHMTPSGDRTASSTDNQATFLMTNIIPQAADNNQGPWNDLENYGRSLVSAGNELYIISGGAGSRGTIAGGKVRIPDRTWKIIVVLADGANDLARVSSSTRVIAVNLPNVQGIRNNPWESYRVSVDSLEALTGYDFLSNVSASIQSVIEARVDGSASQPTATPVGPTATPVAPTATATATPGACISDLFFSEYVEGSGNNKALEIFNGSAAAIDLGASGYSVRLYANGSTSASSSVNLTGVVARNDVFVIANSAASATILAQSDMTNAVASFNGNDALALLKNGVLIDVIGQIGNDPGTEWGSGNASTADNTLRRKASVKAGDAIGSNSFSPALEWDGYASDTFSGLGAHSASCP